MTRAKKNGKLLFIKYSNTFTIKFEDVLVASNDSETAVQTLYHEFKPGLMQASYAPLMDWIGALYKRYFLQMEYNDFLESCDVYPLHVNVFKSYFECGTCRRVETIVRNEAEYEHQHFINDIIKIFNTVSEVAFWHPISQELAHLMETRVLHMIWGYLLFSLDLHADLQSDGPRDG